MSDVYLAVGEPSVEWGIGLIEDLGWEFEPAQLFGFVAPVLCRIGDWVIECLLVGGEGLDNFPHTIISIMLKEYKRINNWLKNKDQPQ